VNEGRTETGQSPRGSADNQLPSKGANRFLVLILVCAILGVLGFGVWLLVGRGRSPAVTQAPLDLGAFYMPGEFDPQDILCLGGEGLVDLDKDLAAAILCAVAPEVRVAVLVGSPEGQATVDRLLAANGLTDERVRPIRLTGVSLWVRDFGPVTVTDTLGRRSLVEFHSAARRGNRMDDDAPPFLARILDLALLGNALELEGGDLVTNGRGLGVLSSRVAEGNAGYPDMSAPDIARTVASVLGFENVVLVQSLAGEGSGHVDRFCNFVAPDLALVGRFAPGVESSNAARLDQIAKDLAGLPTLDGPLRVERIVQPDPADGFWRSYTTAVFANGVVLVPTYPDYCPELDAEALATYRRLLPDRQVVGLDASRLIRSHGTLRDVTLNIPTGSPLGSAN